MRYGLIFLTAIASLFLTILPPVQAALPAAVQGACIQTNATFISCADGIPVRFGFSITGPNAPGFGSFSVTPLDYANVSEPLDSFGNACQVGSGEAAYCTVILSPASVFALNGTVKKEILLRLDSISYPQLKFNSSVNVTIFHYLDKNESLFVSTYLQAFSRYALENDTYLYFCNSYNICNSGVSYGINVAGSYLALAGYDAKLGLIPGAMDNASVANRSLAGGTADYVSFVNTSNRIVNNVIKANYLLAAVSNSYSANKIAIGNCTVGGMTYSKNIGEQLNSTEAYPMQNTLNGSIRYLQEVKNLSTYNADAVTRCSSSEKNGGAASFFHDIYGKNLPEIILIIAIIILAIYAVLRYRSHIEVKRIRDAAKDETADEEMRHGEQPEAEAGADDKAPKDPAAGS